MVKYKVIQLELSDKYPHKVVILKDKEVIWISGYLGPRSQEFIIERLLEKNCIITLREGGLLSEERRQICRDMLIKIQNELKRKGIIFKKFI